MHIAYICYRVVCTPLTSERRAHLLSQACTIHSDAMNKGQIQR